MRLRIPSRYGGLTWHLNDCERQDAGRMLKFVELISLDASGGRKPQVAIGETEPDFGGITL
jgi:hypothetical protein